MNLDTPQIEELLRSMRPTRIPAGLRTRIESAIASAHDPLQSTIASSRPSPLPPALASRLEDALSRIPHPHSQKVVHFPATRPQPTAAPAWKKWAVAAAVALMGATSALLVPNPPDGATASQATTPTQPQPPPSARTPSPSAPNAGALVPAGYRRGLSEAKDEGIVWQPQYGPHRRLKLVYRELVTLRDPSGRVYQVERPRVEYVLVPAKVD